MRSKGAAVAVLALVIAVSFAFFAEAGQKGTVSASGILEEVEVAVSVPVELALIGVEAGGRPALSSGKLMARKPAGTVDTLTVSPGDLVERGAALFFVNEGLAGNNLEKARAQFEYILATIENLEEKKNDLIDKRSELKDTEAELKRKRDQARREFESKYTEGQNKLSQMKEKLTAVRSSLEQAQAGLSAAKDAEKSARDTLEAAQALPDSDPTKSGLIQQAEAMLQAAIQKQAQLNATIAQLSAAKSQLEEGIKQADKGLETGKQQFDDGIKKLDSALVKISDGQQKVKDGISSLSEKVTVLKKRRDQAEVGVAVAKKILDAAHVRAAGPGRIKDAKIAEGSVVYPGQRVMSIVREDALMLDLYIPLKNAGRVKRGDPVEVMVDSDPDGIFKGEVVAVGGKAIFAPSNIATDDLELVRVVKVTVEVINRAGILKAGMPADARIQ